MNLAAKGAFDPPTFKFVVRGIRIEKVADSYTIVFYYKTKTYNGRIEELINDFYNPQMTLGTPENRYEGLVNDINRVHDEYRKDSKDVEIFVVDFRTIQTTYGSDRDGIDFTTIEGEVSASNFIEIMKTRYNLDGERFAALVTEDEDELHEAIDDEIMEKQKRQAMIDRSKISPEKDLEVALTNLREIIGKDGAYKVVKDAMDALVGSADGKVPGVKAKPAKLPKKAK